MDEMVFGCFDEIHLGEKPTLGEDGVSILKAGSFYPPKIELKKKMARVFEF